jgi:hypothetical protein
MSPAFSLTPYMISTKRKAKRKNRGPGLDRLPLPWNAAVRELLRKLRRMLGT